MLGRALSLKRAVRPVGGTRRRASTLIELLVVIFVIALLISILIPSLKRSMDLAHATACRHNLRELGTSLQMYMLENDGWLPVSVPLPTWAVTASAKGGGEGESSAWFGKLFPTYMSDASVLRCPKDPFGYKIAQSGNTSKQDQVADFASYGINDFMLTAGGGYLANVERRPPRRPLDTILVGDLGPDREGGDTARMGSQGLSRNGSLMYWGDGFDPFSGEVNPTWVTRRHTSGIHMLTLNGSVRDARTTEIMRTPIKVYYPACAAGGCTFCNELLTPHYSFAKDRLFWWTGPIPTE